MLAIIGGSGMAQLSCLEISHREIVRTPYGEPSGPLTFGKINKYEIVFLARHGPGHNIPPHAVNYRANLWALNSLSPTRVVSVASVGGIRSDLTPGKIVIPDQIIDHTYDRKFTYFEDTDKHITHIDFTVPYCAKTREYIIKAAELENEEIIDGGVYAAMQGPRLETAAEIIKLEREGGDMVGMTGMPETALAKELGLHYAAIAIVANYAAGRGTNTDAIRLEDVYAVLDHSMIGVRKIIERVVELNGD
jgi:5'-methylthioadenosine phosphorylase